MGSKMLAFLKKFTVSRTINRQDDERVRHVYFNQKSFETRVCGALQDRAVVCATIQEGHAPSSLSASWVAMVTPAGRTQFVERGVIPRELPCFCDREKQ